MLNGELRPGSQHSQQGGRPFLPQSLQLVRRVTEAKLLVRMDAAHDDLDKVRLLEATPPGAYIVKRNLRQESKECWWQQAQQLGDGSCPRPGKEVYVGDTLMERDPHGGRVGFEVIRRTTTAQGQRLPQPELEVHTGWTSLSASSAEVVQLYHDQGTCAQFHSELKSDLDLERLPSGKLAPNARVLLLGMLAYHVLRLGAQTALPQRRRLPAAQRPVLPHPGQRRRRRSVLLDLIYQAARRVYHARRLCLVFGRDNPWFGRWQRLYGRFCAA